MPESGNREVAVLPVGAFGRAVADQIRSLSPGAKVLPGLAEDRFPASGGLLITAMYYEEESLCEAIDRSAHESGISWLPIFMDHPLLQAGPLIGPRRPGCYRCFRRRRAQHETHADLMNDLRNARMNGGTQGYFDHHAVIAASMAWKLACGDDTRGSANSDPAGMVLAWNVDSGVGEADRIIACHGCLRCRRQKPVGADTSAIRTENIKRWLGGDA